MFPATIREVLSNGRLVLDYDHGFGEGVEDIVHVTSRVRMPWHPKFLNGTYAIFLRRNLGHGKILENLEAHWGLCVNILHALSRKDVWRLDNLLGPMHQYYDPKLYDFLTYEQVMNEHAARDRVTGVPMDVARTDDDLLRIGLDVRVFGPEADAEEAPAAASASALAPAEVDEETFCRWAG